MMELFIRNELPEEYREVENLVREAFWGSMDHPTCDGEHYLVHRLRERPSYVPQLDLVAINADRIVGHIIFSLAKIVTDKHGELEVLNFGPLSVLPEYKRQGVGSALMRHSIEKARELGYRGIVFYGHPDYYPRFGFRRAAEYGITSCDDCSFDALMAMELYPGAFSDAAGRFYEDEVFDVQAAEWEEFDKSFPAKAPARLLPIDELNKLLPAECANIFAAQEIQYVSQLLRFSGAEMLAWEGADIHMLEKINNSLSVLGCPQKTVPTED